MVTILHIFSIPYMKSELVLLLSIAELSFAVRTPAHKRCLANAATEQAAVGDVCDL